MKSVLFKSSILLVLTLIFGCQNQGNRRETIINTVKTEAINKDGKVSIDSVYVSKKGTNKDSLSFYKNKEFMGSVVIMYE
ncbi:MAG: hypothetical protein KGZ81_13800 [Flavobacteriales bacterium]|jgi:hypothetical protein|nr:hypothetical protein [Flavobacteriales bacterium]